MTTTRRTRRIVATVAGLALLAGCGGYADTEVPAPPKASPPAPGNSSDCTTTPETLESVEPSRNGGPTIDSILENEELRVGVSADTYLMGYRNAIQNRMEGFDIEIARRIGKEIAATFNKKVHVSLVVITAGQRIPMLEEGKLDLVARNMTINCSRILDEGEDDPDGYIDGIGGGAVQFSAEYFHGLGKVLVRSDIAANYSGIEDLEGLRVCAPFGTTSLTTIAEEVPGAEAVPAATHTGCLVEFQQGRVDAIVGDDTVLAGLAAQDPYAAVPPTCDPGQTSRCQEPLSDEPYGIAANRDADDLVAFVNAVLEEMGDDGSWDRLYNRYLRAELGAGAVQPAPSYK